MKEEECEKGKSFVVMDIVQAVDDESISLTDRGLIAQLAKVGLAENPFGALEVVVREDMVVGLMYSGIIIERQTTDDKGYGWWVSSDDESSRSLLYPWVMHYSAVGGGTQVVNLLETLEDAVSVMSGVLAAFDYVHHLARNDKDAGALISIASEFVSILDKLDVEAKR